MLINNAGIQKRYEWKDSLYDFAKEEIKVYDVLPPLVATDMLMVQSTQRRMNAEECAREIIEGIEQNKPEIMPGKARILLGIHRICPKLFREIMAHK